MNDNMQSATFLQKIFDLGGFRLKPEAISSKQKIILWSFLILTIIVKVFLIPYNMMDMGDSATRVWNALMWAQRPFFVLPKSGYPGWFYLMGPIIMITKEFFYTSAAVMILLMTVAGYYVYKTTLILTDFKTAFITLCIFMLNPVIFRLNFEPYSQQPFLTMACITVFFFIKAMGSEESKKYFILSGLFAFLGLFQRFEILCLALPFCIIAFASKKEGRYHFIVLSLIFEPIYLFFSQIVYGNPLKPFMVGYDQVAPNSIQGLSLGVRMFGFFLPYYFIVIGVTFVLFWYFFKGMIFSYKSFPKSIFIVLMCAVFMPALLNGIQSLWATLYYMTHYMYFAYYFAPVFAGIGLSRAVDKYKSPALKFSFVSIVILTCIPFSYMKDFVPAKFNKAFPKVMQFIVTSEDPDDARQMIDFIDKNIKLYPALIFDEHNSASSIFYVPYRTMLPAPPAYDSRVLISGYDSPPDKDGLREAIRDFMQKNKSGIIMVKKSGTPMSEIFSELLSNKPYVRNDIQKAGETEKWNIYLYKQ